MFTKKNLDIIKKDGILVLENFYDKDECKKLVRYSEKLLSKLKSKSKFSKYCQVINSPFQYDSFFFKYVLNKRIDLFMKNLIDEHYVLLNSNIINRSIENDINSKRGNMGEKWHTDSRLIGKRSLEPGISYIIVTMLEDFTNENASTEFIRSSHKKNISHLSKITKDKNKIKKLTGKSGTVAIFDSKLMHRGGASTKNSRWSIYSYYGPWFIKPYFDYRKMLGKKINTLKKPIKKILHFYSTPPKNDYQRNFTLEYKKYI
jgi:ectoine hydroxylase-related dioxygenase (phytanoyl-CoA dioxygenase family)